VRRGQPRVHEQAAGDGGQQGCHDVRGSEPPRRSGR
jgi:hypothetical protein